MAVEFEEEEEDDEEEADEVRRSIWDGMAVPPSIGMDSLHWGQMGGGAETLTALQAGRRAEVGRNIG